MAEKGIFIKVLPQLELAALSAVVSQMKGIFGKAGAEISGELSKTAANVKKLEEQMIASSNRAANAQIAAAKKAADAQVVEARRGATAEAGRAKAVEDRTASEIAAISAVDTARAKAAQSAKEAEQATGKATKATADHEAAAAAAAGSTTKLGTAFNGLGMAATGAFAIIGGVGVKEASKYEAGMARIQVATGETTQNIKGLADGIMQLGPQVGQSMDALQQAAYTVEKSADSIQGLQDPTQRVAGTLNILKAASQLAAVEGADLDTTVKGLTTSMSDFGIPADKAMAVAAKFQVAIGDSKVPIQDFMGALHSIEPVAMSAGVGLDQVSTLIARMTQNGMSADQATQNLADGIRHMIQATGPQAEALGQLGLNASTLSKELGDPNVGYLGVINQISDAMRSKMDPAGRVVFDAMFQNEQAIKNLKTAYDNLSPAMQKYADQAQKGELPRKDLMALKTEGPEAGAFQQYISKLNQAEGYSNILKRNQDLAQTQAAAWQKVTGTNAGQLVGIMTNGSQENKDATASVLKDIQQAVPTATGDLQGWAKVQDTLSQKIKETNSSLQAMAVNIGNALLPVAKQFADVLRDVFGFLSNHKAILDGIVITLGTMATAWLTVKTAMMFKTVFDAMVSGLEIVIGSWRTLRGTAELTNTELAASGPAAARGAAGVETAATAEMAAMDGVAASARTAATAISAVAIGIPVATEAWNNFIKNNDTLRQNELNNPLAQNPVSEWINRHTPSWLGGDPHWQKNDPMPPPNGGTAWTQGKHFEIGKGWVDDNTLSAPTTPTIPLPPPGPDQLDNGGGTPDLSAINPGGGGKGKGNKPATELPTGEKTDPIYVDPADPANFKNSKDDVGLNYDPFQQAGSGGFTLPNIARLLATWAANEALGNPYGKLQAEKRGGDPSNPLYVQDVNGNLIDTNSIKAQAAANRVNSAQLAYDNAVAKYGPDSQEAITAGGRVNSARASQQELAVRQSMPTKRRSGGYAAAGPGAEAWRSTVADTVAKYGPQVGINTPEQRQAWTDAIVSQIQTESSGNPGADNPHDSNGRGGIQHVAGLLQYLPSSYANSGGALTGLPYMDPVGQIAGAMFAPRDANGMPTGIGNGVGWGPVSTPINRAAAPAPAPSLGPSLKDANNAAAKANNTPLSLLFGGGGNSPVFKRSPAPASPSVNQYGPRVPGQGLIWSPTHGWIPNGPGISLGTGQPAAPAGPIPGTDLFKPGGVLGGQVAPPHPTSASIVNTPSAPKQPSTNPSANTGGYQSGGQQFAKPDAGKGFGIGGGLIGMGESAASMGIGGALGGGGAAAGAAGGGGGGGDIAAAEANRFVGYVGQLAGIGVEGLLETFALNDSPIADPSKSIFGKIAFGLAGAHPTGPNTAGQTAPPLKPQDDPNRTEHKGTGQPPGPAVNIENQHFHGDNQAAQVNQEQNRNMMQWWGGNPT